MADMSSIIPSLPFPQNINDMIIFGMLVVSGFIYLFYWRTEKTFRKDSIKFEFDVLLLSLVFSSIFIIITLTLIVILNMMSVNAIGKMLIPAENNIISFDFLVYEYLVVLISILIFNKTKSRKWIANFSKKFYDKGLEYTGLVVMVIIMGPIGLYFSNKFIIVSTLVLLMGYCFVLIPFLIVIEITKRLLKNNSLV